jgi:pimeloyl-ACP methyl ester carboxylesterase
MAMSLITHWLLSALPVMWERAHRSTREASRRWSGSDPRRVATFIVASRRPPRRQTRTWPTSDTVDAPQHPEDVIGDLRNLLDAAGIEPPYVLLGASFGGLPAYLYANQYPDEVVGMVLLDAMFPDLLSIDDLLPAEFRQEASSEDDLNNSLERISHFEMLTEAQQYIGNEPQIPLIFLASEQDPPTSGVPEWDEEIVPVATAFVDRFDPGELIWVDAPHFMESAIPDEITDALLRVVDQATTG